MTNAEMLSNLMGRLGSRTAASLRATVLFELNEKIRQFEEGAMMPWFLEGRWDELAATNPAIMTAGVDFVDLPADFLRESDDENMGLEIQLYPEVTWDDLPKVDYATLRKGARNIENSLPKGYAIYGERIYFGPTPNVTYIFRLPYYKRTTPVVDTPVAMSNPWLLNFYNFVTLETLDFVARTHTRDELLVNNLMPQLGVARDLFWRAVEARKHAGRTYLLGNEEN